MGDLRARFDTNKDKHKELLGEAQKLETEEEGFEGKANEILDSFQTQLNSLLEENSDLTKCAYDDQEAIGSDFSVQDMLEGSKYPEIAKNIDFLREQILCFLSTDSNIKKTGFEKVSSDVQTKFTDLLTTTQTSLQNIRTPKQLQDEIEESF